MILITIITGFLIITGSVIAGFLMYSQLKGSSDAVESGMAVFATDAGVEEALYTYYKTTNPFGINLNDGSGGSEMLVNISPSLTNNASAKAKLWCVGADRRTQVDCKDFKNVYGFRVRSIGSTHRTERILETFYVVKYN